MLLSYTSIPLEYTVARQTKIRRIYNTDICGSIVIAHGGCRQTCYRLQLAAYQIQIRQKYFNRYIIQYMLCSCVVFSSFLLGFCLISRWRLPLALLLEIHTIEQPVESDSNYDILLFCPACNISYVCSFRKYTPEWWIPFLFEMWHVSLLLLLLLPYSHI